jgi:predicted nucleotidyltransferase
MEDKINALLDAYYPGLPAFLLGSRVNGNSNEKSDWDVGVIGTNEAMEIDNGNVCFIPINPVNLDKKAAQYIFRRDIHSLARKIKPLKKEKIVRDLERKAKGHIVQYVRQKLGKESVSGEEVIRTYCEENMKIFPFFRVKGLRFLKSKNSVSISSQIYDEFLRDFKQSQMYTYRDKKSDRILYFLETNFNELKDRPYLSNFIKHTKNFVRSATNFISEITNS